MSGKKITAFLTAVLIACTGVGNITVFAQETSNKFGLSEEEIEKIGSAIRDIVNKKQVKPVNRKTEDSEITEKEYLLTEENKIKRVEAGAVWTYNGNKFPVYVKNKNDLDGIIVNMSLDDITIGDSSVLSILHDNTSNSWEITALKNGKCSITFFVSDGKKQYTINDEIIVGCDHLMTAGERDAANIVSQMKQWLGFNEKDKTHRAIIDIYNSHEPLAAGYKMKYTDSWCAATVSAAAIVCGLTDVLPTECSCERMRKLLIDIDAWQEDESVTPAPGWIIFYDWQDDGKGDNTGWPEHVGIVEKVSGSKITVIEGNYSDSVKRRTISVNAKDIRGYGVPQYSIERIKATTTKSGLLTDKCADCGKVMKTTEIPAIASVSLNYTKYTYNGEAKTPKVTVKDAKGNVLTEESDYTVKYESGRAKVWKYDVYVTFKNNYEGKETLTFSVNPPAPAKVTVNPYGIYDDVKVSWSESEGADGYYVYYKKGEDTSYTKLTTTTKRNCIVTGLSEGYNYTYKIVPYYVYEGEHVLSHKYTTASITI